MKRQFGVWMDGHKATIVGRVDAEVLEFAILGHAGNKGAPRSGSEKSEQNDEKSAQHKFYKEILTHMQNAEEVHLTGTGDSQEQFMHYMADTPQFKNTVTHESTSNKMSDKNLTEYIAAKFS